MNVAHLVMGMDVYSGGVPTVIYNLCKALTNYQLKVSIHCPYYGKEIINQYDKSIQTYLYKAKNLFGLNISLSLLKMVSLKELDILHSHGIWEISSLVSYRWKKKNNKILIISPHGMLDEWAICNSGFKKRIARILYENNNLRAADCIHAGSLSELNSIRNFGLKNPVCIIPNGVEIYRGEKITPDWYKNSNKAKKKLLFLGRLHPKKGVMELLMAWNDIMKIKKYNAEWDLIISGWGDADYTTKIKQYISLNNLGSNVNIINPQYGRDKIGTFQSSDAFILPSYSEGFPMAILDAWSFGLPVLMTKQCNIPEGFEKNAAIEISPNSEDIKEKVILFFDSDPILLKAMIENGYEIIKSKFNWNSVGNKMMELYNWLQKGGVTPDIINL